MVAQHPSVGVAELAPQPVGVDADIPRLLAVAGGPDGQQDHLVRADLPGMAGEEAEEGELVRGELQRPPVEPGGQVDEIERDPADVHLGRLGRGPSAIRFSPGQTAGPAPRVP